MKILKIILIFIVLIGGIFLALNWDSLFSDTSTVEIGDDNKIDTTKECDEIRKAWDNTDKWNQALYEDQKSAIEQKNLSHRYKENSFEVVMNTLKECAIDKASQGYLNVLKDSANFSHDVLCEQYDGVCTLKTDFNLSVDKRATDIIDIHSLYLLAKQFVEDPHTPTAKFNEQFRNWVSLESYIKEVLNKLKTIKDNKHYEAIQFVPMFVKGLNKDYIVQNIQNEQQNFYEDLSGQIVKYFTNKKNACKTKEQLKVLYGQLDNIKNTFNKQSHYGEQELVDLLEVIKNAQNDFTN